MANTPAAELILDETLVQELLRTQCPGLADLPVSRYENGWDNEMFALGDSLLVRLPRRARAVPLTEHEIRWLPGLAEHLPVATPVPVFVGTPSERFGWPWTIIPLLPGHPAVSAEPAARGRWAESLADFLGALHLPAPLGAPENPVRGHSLDQPRVHGAVAERLAALDHDADALRRRWDAWSAAPEWQLPDVWLHGDLHPLNLLASDDELTAVVDWGDMTSGDPACDLATAWLTFDEAGRRAFVHRAGMSGLYDAATWDRAKAWALHLGLVFAQTSDDSPVLRRIGVDALAALVAEPVGPSLDAVAS